MKLQQSPLDRSSSYTLALTIGYRESKTMGRAKNDAMQGTSATIISTRRKGRRVDADERRAVRCVLVSEHNAYSRRTRDQWSGAGPQIAGGRGRAEKPRQRRTFVSSRCMRLRKLEIARWSSTTAVDAKWAAHRCRWRKRSVAKGQDATRKQKNVAEGAATVARTAAGRCGTRREKKRRKERKGRCREEQSCTHRAEVTAVGASRAKRVMRTFLPHVAEAFTASRLIEAAARAGDKNCCINNLLPHASVTPSPCCQPKCFFFKYPCLDIALINYRYGYEDLFFF